MSVPAGFYRFGTHNACRNRSGGCSFIRENGCREWPAINCTRIEIQPVGTLVGEVRLERRVAVNYETAVVANVRQEGLAYPAKVVIVLLIERPQRIYASVDE